MRKLLMGLIMFILLIGGCYVEGYGTGYGRAVPSGPYGHYQFYRHLRHGGGHGPICQITSHPLGPYYPRYTYGVWQFIPGQGWTCVVPPY